MTIDICEELDDAVEEYLEYRRFPNTLECFRSEIRHRKLMRNRLEQSDEEQGRRSSFDEDGQHHREKARMHSSSVTLLKCFDRGDMHGILSAWSAFIPKPLLRREASSPLAHEVRVAEFLSCVHCAVLPFRAAALAAAAGPREASVACAKSMSSFRRYLDRATLPPVQDSEVVTFYALPHVPDPSAHPAFRDLFDDSWSAGLRARIEDLVRAVRQWRRSDPLLVRLLLRQDQAQRPPDTFITAGGDDGYGGRGMVENTTRGGGSIGRGVEDQEARAPPHSNDVGGESSSSSSILSCSRIEGGGGWDGETSTCRRGRRSNDAPDGSAAPPKGQRQRLSRSNSDQPILGRVDYKAVKRDLRRLAGEISEGVRDDSGRNQRLPPSEAVASAAIEAALILQTIRWRFARAPPGKTRRGVLYHLIRNDVFDLRPAEAGKEGGGGQAVAVTTLLELLLRLGAPSPSSRPSLSPPPPLQPLSPDVEQTKSMEQSHGAQHQSDGTEHASQVKQQQPGGLGDVSFAEEDGAGERGGWEEFGGDPGRLVAEYATRLLGVLVSLSKARSYVLGERRADTIALLAETLQGDGFRETSLAKRLLGVLARLSGRRVAQESIAASCFVDWAAKMLGSQGAGSRDPCPLILKRTAEILGNTLCTSAGKAAAVAATPDLLGSLGNLLEHEDGQVKYHAFGALRLLLETREARQRALATGMDAVLQDLRSRTSTGSDDHPTFAQDIESLLNLLGGDLIPDAGRETSDNGGLEEADVDVDVEDFDSLSDDEPVAEASVVCYFVRATNVPCGEELLRERYRLSTAEAKEEALVGSSDGRPPWGGEEEELVCGGYKTRKMSNSHQYGAGDSKVENKTPRVPLPEAGTATLIRGEAKVYDSRRPGLPEEMQSRPRIPRTPAGSFDPAHAPFGGSGRRPSNGATADAKSAC